MATTSRLLLRTSAVSSSSSTSSSSSFSNSQKLPMSTILRCLSKAGFSGGEKRLSGIDERKPVVKAVAATERVGTAIKQAREGVDLAFLLANVKDAGIQSLKLVTKRRPWSLYIQMFIERVVLNCRFFTMFAVAGSLLGSVLCFVEGCFMILESYLQYFHALSQSSDQGHVVQLIIEAIDMFLIGTAMLIFGIGLHVMFIGSRTSNGKGSSSLPGSNFFGLFNLQKLPSWVGMESITEAKSKIGHALMMILQVGVLEKFKSIPLVTGLDLACFAGALFVSSACIFLLSRLSAIGTTTSTTAAAEI